MVYGSGTLASHSDPWGTRCDRVLYLNYSYIVIPLTLRDRPDISVSLQDISEIERPLNQLRDLCSNLSRDGRRYRLTVTGQSPVSTV
jgi:hypothetical protein